VPEKNPAANDARGNLERHIGQTVRKLRRQQNLTIAEISCKAEISTGMLSRIENSQTSASLDTLAMRDGQDAPMQGERRLYGADSRSLPFAFHRKIHCIRQQSRVTGRNVLHPGISGIDAFIEESDRTPFEVQ